MIRSIIMGHRGLGLLAVGALVVLLGADEGDCTGSPTINNTVIVCASANGGGNCENEVVATGEATSGGVGVVGTYSSSDPLDARLVLPHQLDDGTVVHETTKDQHLAEILLMLEE
jgi:hypothetical protein